MGLYLKIYEIKNKHYATKRVVGIDMENALQKYRKYLSENINADFSDQCVFAEIESCTYVGEYQGDDYIK